VLNTPHRQKFTCKEPFRDASDLVFVSDRMKCTVLKICWRDIIIIIIIIIIQNAYTLPKDSKESFYEELELVFDHFPNYHTKTLFGGCNADLGREKLT